MKEEREKKNMLRLNTEQGISNIEGKKEKRMNIECRKMVRRRCGFFSQQSIMMPRHHPAPMKTDTNELAQHIGPPRRRERSAAFLRYSVFLVHYSIFIFVSGLSGLRSGQYLTSF
jgi:hypothetical protein